jgi:LTXXQ motif family protein
MAGFPGRLAAALILLFFLQACTDTGGERRGRRGEGDTAREPANPTMAEVTRLSANDRFRIHLADVKVALNLTPLQVPLWQAYENKVMEAIAEEERSAAALPADSAPDQIDRQVRAASSRIALLEQASAAARKLYASLTDEQRPIADRMLAGTLPAVSVGPTPTPRGER